MRGGVLAADVVGVVRRDETQPLAPCQVDEHRVNERLLRDAVIHQLDEEVLLAENPRIPLCGELRGLVVSPQQVLGHLALQAGAHRDQASGVSLQQLEVDARAVVEALDESRGRELEKVPVTLVVFREKDQVTAFLGAAVTRLAPPRRHVGLAADYRLYTRTQAGAVERQDAVHDAVVRDRERIHPSALDGLEELALLSVGLVHLAGAVEQGVIGMHVQVRETGRHLLSSLCATLYSSHPGMRPPLKARRECPGAGI